MKVGWYDSLDTMPTTGAVRRAIKIAKESLLSQGFELVPFSLSIEEVHRFRDIFVAYFSNYLQAPAAEKFNMEGEKLSETFFRTKLAYDMPKSIRGVLTFLINLSGNGRLMEFAKYC